jgi:hypothetical protein
MGRCLMVGRIFDVGLVSYQGVLVCRFEDGDRLALCRFGRLLPVQCALVLLVFCYA